MPILRIALTTGRPGEFPETCMICGKPSTSLVGRTFSVARSLEGTLTHTAQVPACDACAGAIAKEGRFKWLTILGCVGLFFLSIYLLTMDLATPGLICLGAIVVAIIAFWRYNRLYGVPCLEMNDRYALLKVRTAAFADAYRAHYDLGGESEAPADMVARMQAEGCKRARIASALEARGLSSMDASATIDEFNRGRGRTNRAIGLRRIGIGTLLLGGGIGASVLAPNTIFVGAIVFGIAYFGAGVVQLLTGTGDRL